MKFSQIFCVCFIVFLYVCRLCTNFQDLCARLLGMAALRILLLTFTSRFVIDFLSIRKVIIFSATATDDRHPLWSCSIIDSRVKGIENCLINTYQACLYWCEWPSVYIDTSSCFCMVCMVYGQQWLLLVLCTCICPILFMPSCHGFIYPEDKKRNRI